MWVPFQCGSSFCGGLRATATQPAVEKDLRRDQRSVCCIRRHNQQDSALQWQGKLIYFIQQWNITRQILLFSVCAHFAGAIHVIAFAVGPTNAAN